MVDVLSVFNSIVDGLYSFAYAFSVYFMVVGFFFIAYGISAVLVFLVVRSIEFIRKFFR